MQQARQACRDARFDEARAAADRVRSRAADERHRPNIREEQQAP